MEVIIRVSQLALSCRSLILIITVIINLENIITFICEKHQRIVLCTIHQLIVLVTSSQPVPEDWPKLLPARVSSIQYLVRHLDDLRSVWQLQHLAHEPEKKIKGMITFVFNHTDITKRKVYLFIYFLPSLLTQPNLAPKLHAFSAMPEHWPNLCHSPMLTGLCLSQKSMI